MRPILINLIGISIIIAVIIGCNVGISMGVLNSNKYYEEHTINTTCYIAYYNIDKRDDYYILKYIVLQLRHEFNYTENLRFAFTTKDKLDSYITSFPQPCYYVDDSSIYFYYPLPMITSVGTIITCCIIVDIFIILIGIFFIVNLHEKKYTTLN